MSTGGLASLIRLHRWRIDQKRRDLAELEQKKSGCVQQIQALTAEIEAEQTGADDAVLAFAYANYVEAALVKRRTLSDALAEMDGAVAAKRAEIAAAYRDLKKFEVAETQRLEREAVEEARREQSAMDEVALNLYRRPV